MSSDKRCPFYEEDIFEGLTIQVFCEHPQVCQQVYQDKTPVCPYTTEYECDIPLHTKNMEKMKNDT